MAKYPSELISDMADVFIPSRYRVFFESNFSVKGTPVGRFMDYIGYGGLTFYYLVDDVINFSLKGASSKKEISNIYRNYKNHLLRKRTALYDSIVESIRKNEISYGPLAAEAEALSIDNDADKIRELKEAGINKITQWFSGDGPYKNRKSFIDCPYFGWASKTVIKNSYKSDILGEILEYIRKNLDGDLADYFVPYAQEYIGKPLFSPTGQSVQLQELTANIYGLDIKDDSGLTILRSAYSNFMPPGKPIKVLSADAKTVLQYLSNQVTNIGQFAVDGSVDVSAWELASIFYNGNPPAGYEERIETILQELFSWYYFYNGEGFHYLDYSTTYKDGNGHKRYNIVLGGVTKKAIIEHKFVRIKKSDYDKLSNPLCLILAHFLKFEQVLRYPYDDDGDKCENGYIRYDYNVWRQNVNFQSNNKSEIFLLIEDALKEFKENKVIVYDYLRRQNDFLVKFFSPSQYELEDKA